MAVIFSCDKCGATATSTGIDTALPMKWGSDVGVTDQKLMTNELVFRLEVVSSRTMLFCPNCLAAIKHLAKAMASDWPTIVEQWMVLHSLDGRKELRQ